MARELFADANESQRRGEFEAIRDALAPFVTADGVRSGAAAWLVVAHRPR